MLASVVANYFDFGIMGFDASEDKFEATFKKYFEHGLDVDDTPKMLGLLQDVVYIAVCRKLVGARADSYDRTPVFFR